MAENTTTTGDQESTTTPPNPSAPPAPSGSPGPSAPPPSSSPKPPKQPPQGRAIRNVADLRDLFFKYGKDFTRSQNAWDDIVAKAAIKALPKTFGIGIVNNNGLASLSAEFFDWKVARTLCKWNSKKNFLSFNSIPIVLVEEPPRGVAEDGIPANKSPHVKLAVERCIRGDWKMKQRHVPVGEDAENEEEQSSTASRAGESAAKAEQQPTLLPKTVEEQLQANRDILREMKNLCDLVASNLPGLKKDFEFLDTTFRLCGEKCTASTTSPDVPLPVAEGGPETSAAAERRAGHTHNSAEPQEDCESLRLLNSLQKIEIDILGQSKAQLEAENAMLRTLLDTERSSLVGITGAIQRVIAESVDFISSIAQDNTSSTSDEEPKRESLDLRDLLATYTEIVGSTNPVLNNFRDIRYSVASTEARTHDQDRIEGGEAHDEHPPEANITQEEQVMTASKASLADDHDTVVIVTNRAGDGGMENIVCQQQPGIGSDGQDDTNAPPVVTTATTTPETDISHEEHTEAVAAAPTTAETGCPRTPGHSGTAADKNEPRDTSAVTPRRSSVLTSKSKKCIIQ